VQEKQAVDVDVPIENITSTKEKEKEQTPGSEKDKSNVTKPETANKSKAKKPQVDGLSKIGLKRQEVLQAIEYLPNAERCENFVFQFRRVKRRKPHKSSENKQSNKKKEKNKNKDKRKHKHKKESTTKDHKKHKKTEHSKKNMSSTVEGYNNDISNHTMLAGYGIYPTSDLSHLSSTVTTIVETKSVVLEQMSDCNVLPSDVVIDLRSESGSVQSLSKDEITRTKLNSMDSRKRTLSDVAETDCLNNDSTIEVETLPVPPTKRVRKNRT